MHVYAHVFTPLHKDIRAGTRASTHAGMHANTHPCMHAGVDGSMRTYMQGIMSSGEYLLMTRPDLFEDNWLQQTRTPARTYTIMHAPACTHQTACANEGTHARHGMARSAHDK